MSKTYSCIQCDEWVHSKRWALGYRTCRACGEQAARAERKSWCVAQAGHKQGFTLHTRRSSLSELTKQAR